MGPESKMLKTIIENHRCSVHLMHGIEGILDLALQMVTIVTEKILRKPTIEITVLM